MGNQLLWLALAGMYAAYLLGRARMAAERPMGGFKQTWVVTRDNRIAVLLIAEDESATKLELDPQWSRKFARSVLDLPDGEDDASRR